jgi:Fibronectin type III domain
MAFDARFDSRFSPVHCYSGSSQQTLATHTDQGLSFSVGQNPPSGFPGLVGPGGTLRSFRARTIALLTALAFLGLQPLAGQSVVRTITIAWDASPSSEVVGYSVHYGTRSGEYSREIDVGNHTTAEIPNLIDGTTYFFAVTGYTGAGEQSPASDELMHTVDPALFLNMSTRAMVQSGDAVMISGFIIGGSTRKKVVIRASGPSLAAAGVAGALADPAIELHGPNGLIAANDNWRDGNPDELNLLQFAPGFDVEAALVTELVPGAYTVIVRGANGSTGIALVEVYDGGIPLLPWHFDGH